MTLQMLQPKIDKLYQSTGLIGNATIKNQDLLMQGLNGCQAAWKYKGHRVLPEGILEELDKKHIV